MSNEMFTLTFAFANTRTIPDTRSLRSINIPDSVTSLRESAFGGTNLTSVILPDSIVYTEDYVFQAMINLISIQIPGTCGSLGSYMLQNCLSLTSFVFPDSVTSIGFSFFYGCTSLVSVTIPDTVTRA